MVKVTESQCGLDATIETIEDQQSILGQFFENSSQEILLFQPNPIRILALNKAARNNLGYTVEQLNSLSPSEYIPEFNLDSILSPFRTIINGGSGQINFSTLMRRIDGSLYPADIELRSLDYKGNRYCLALLTDLSTCTSANSELQKKEAILRAVMDTAHDAIVMIDHQAKVAFWNMAAEKLFGYSKEEILGKSLRRLVTLDEQAYEAYRNALKLFQSTRKGNAVEEKIELATKRKDSRQVDVELSISALRISNCWQAIVIMRDISERKQAQRELEESRQKYLELAENAPIGILTCDNQGNITYVNQCALDIVGSTSFEATKEINLLTFPLLLQYGFSAKLASCLQSGQAATHDLNYQSKWGKNVWIKLHIKPRVIGTVVEGAQIIIDDISEQKQLEKQLRLLSVTDTLTNTYNRRFFIQKLGEEIERARRLGSTFSVIMLDVDHFKNINDTYGHNAGDQVLKMITSEISMKIRNLDTLARWGGEEFFILLPGTQVDYAAVIANRLREAISQLKIEEVGSVTASFGVYGYNSGDTVKKIIQDADIALYNAKSTGRNCVQCLELESVVMES